MATQMSCAKIQTSNRLKRARSGHLLFINFYHTMLKDTAVEDLTRRHAWTGGLLRHICGLST